MGSPAHGETLRAAYIVSNLAQAVRDPATGEIRGAVADIARELGRRFQRPVTIRPVATAGEVIGAVQTADVDIGFVAPNPARMVVLYSQTYMLVQQSFLVRDGSPITAVAEVDRAGRTVGANTDDSVSLYMKTHFTHAKIIETPDYSLRIGAQWLADGTIDAFGGNRQRLKVSSRGFSGLHLLADNLYGVPQAIAVANGRRELLAAIDTAIDDMRASGFLKAALERSGSEGIDVAP